MAGGFTAGVRVQRNDFPAIALDLEPKVDLVQRKICEDIVAGAARRTLRVQTGAMKGGYEVSKVGHLEYIVYNLMHYHIYHELGTVHIAAMPMLIPALEAVRDAYSQAIIRVLSRR
jgi:hypothetical protein